jgi:hypothetical protein
VVTPEEFDEKLGALAHTRDSDGSGTKSGAGADEFSIVTPDASVVAVVSRLTSNLTAGFAGLEIVSSVLAPSIGRIAHARALRGDVSDALTLDANYVRRTDAEMKWKDG